MHNSLFIKNIIKRVNSLDMVKERRDPHRNVFRDENVLANEFEVEIKGNIIINVNVDPRANSTIGEDFADFLNKMDVIGNIIINASDVITEVDFKPQTSNFAFGSETVVYSQEKTCNKISDININLFTDFCERDFSVRVDRESLTITAGGISGAWAGLTYVENKMKEKRAPILKIEEYNKTARWDNQISQGPWNANYSVPDFDEEYLSEDCFKTYAHYGVNNMMIYGDLLIYSNSDVLPELKHPDYKESIRKLKDAAKRAIKYGVQFSYLAVTPKLTDEHPVFINHKDTKGAGIPIATQKDKNMYFLCSSSKKVLDYYEDVFYNLFKEVPELAGTTFIVASESFYHCKIWEGVRPEAIKCPVCKDKSYEEVVAGQVTAARDGVKAANPKAFVNVWAYTLFSDRVKLHSALPQDVNVWYTIEKDTLHVKEGYTKDIWDYSIDCIGPGYDTLRLKKHVKETGKKFFIKTETGIGLETIQFPYVPALYHLGDKWESVKSICPNGVQQSWLFFGMFGSRAEELAYWACYENCSKDDYIYKMAVRDFGEENACKVTTSWKFMSKAVRHLPTLQCPYYYGGPLFMGPCHPLLLEDDVPEIFNVKLFYLLENEETFSMKSIEDISVTLAINSLSDSIKTYGIYPHDNNDKNWQLIIDEYSKSMKYAKCAYDLLKELTVHEKLKSHLVDDLNITELYYRTMMSCVNTFEFLVNKEKYKETKEGIYYKNMLDIARNEGENAKSARHIFVDAPYLNLKERIDGYYNDCIDMIDAKVEIIDDMLNN